MTDPRNAPSSPRTPWRVGGALLVGLLAGSPALASTNGADERLNSNEYVDPNIIFLIDRSVDMSSPCDASTTDSCWTTAVRAITDVVLHYEDAHYGVVGTVQDTNDSVFYPIAPVGSSAAEIATALAAAAPVTSGNTRNLAESLQDLAFDYLMLTDYENFSDDDSDGMTGDWAESPILYSCTNTYVIVLTRDRPFHDADLDTVVKGATPSPTDVMCNGGGATSVDSECFFDNTVAHFYNYDLQPSLSDTQRMVVNTISLGSVDTLTSDLFTSAAEQTGGEGVYTNASEADFVLGAILETINNIKAGTYARSTPVLTSDDAYLIYTFYEVNGEHPLAQGHIRGYRIDNDPSSATYGQIDYTGDPDTTAYGGAVWDGGDLLVCRPVTSAEYNPEDRDGVGKRDIYTWEPTVSIELPADYMQKRLGYDKEFADAVSGSPTVFSLYFDSSNSAYDLDRSGTVDGADYQKLVDFVRGYPYAEYRYFDDEHGWWKLGDSPYSVPVVVTPRDERYSNNPVYKEFIEDLEFQGYPAIVLIAANDGMLHAFRLEDDPMTSTDDEAGQELWAWVPGYLLLRDHGEEWASTLMDMTWYGRTWLFDGSPVVDDVWIDADGDGGQTPEEWHRVVVVQQGFGGPDTLALDITDPQSPTFLWEQRNSVDTSAGAATVSRPVIANIYDDSDPSLPVDRYVTFWGSGRAVGYTGTSGNEYFRSVEPNLFIYAMGDDYFSGGMTTPRYSVQGDNAGSVQPDDGETTGTLQYGTSDSAIEYGYISGALAAVDANNDGDVDVLYFPYTTAYRPTDESGAGPTDIASPGSSWIYKAVVSTDNPGDLEWCEFFDPMDGADGEAGITSRPEVFYAVTTAWLGNGTRDLGIYWGTGTPFDRNSSDPGYFFFMKDASPMDCTSTAQPLACIDPDTGTPVSTNGIYPLADGEGLSSDPMVYAGVVYFTTYTPAIDRCELGEGKIYGLTFDECAPGMDTNNDGTVDGSDAAAISAGPNSGYVSNLTVTDQGTLLYASPSDSSYHDPNINMITPAEDPFRGTATVTWMEIF